jgi:serine/threonine protein kinase
MPGQKIGRFEILNVLGQGEQGIVHLAHDSQLDRQVAIKTLTRNGPLNDKARLVSRLHHPNIVALLDSGEHQGRPYLVYAYVDGETLARSPQQTLVRAAEIACGVLEGLAYAHAQGIAHLDIKPSNVMISSSGVPMLMDFGLAGGGADPYTAPGLMSGERVDARADLYSLGLLLYEMVTGVAVPRETGLSGQAGRIAAPSTQNERVDATLEAIIL